MPSRASRPSTPPGTSSRSSATSRAGPKPLFRALHVPLAFVASSETWDVQKPDPAFFERIVRELGLPADEIAYVGDRLDNDIRPAAAVGMQAVFVRRGPWAWIHGGRSTPPEAALTVDSLAELPDALDALR